MFIPTWEAAFGPDASALQNLYRGVSVSFKAHGPPLTRDSVKFACRSSRQQVSVAVQALLDKKVIVPVRDKSSLGFYSRLFLVPKRNGELRPVFDLTVLNRL